MTKPKITIAGSGHIGSAAAFRLGLEDLCDICLTDIDADKARAKALDLSHAMILEGKSTQITACFPPQTKGSKLFIIAAGYPRAPGIDRDQLFKNNRTVVESIIDDYLPHSPRAIVVNVTNPVDRLVDYILDRANLPPHQVLGLAGSLDTARFHYFLSQNLKTPASKINALVIGPHNDSMLPLLSHTKINNQPLSPHQNTQLKPAITQTKQAGHTIVSLLKTGSAYHAPASALTRIAKAILTDAKTPIPCSVRLQGEYGINNRALSVPVILGKHGAEKIIPLKLSPKELTTLKTFKENP